MALHLPIILFLLLVILLGICMRPYAPNWRTYARSSWEFLVTFLFGNLPFLVLLAEIAFNGEDSSLSDFFMAEGRPGQVLIYVSAFLAPVVYTFLTYFKQSTPTWHTIYFFLILACLGTSLYLFLEYSEIGFLVNSKIDLASAALYLCALAIWFYSIVYQRALHEQNFKAQHNKTLRSMREGNY